MSELEQVVNELTRDIEAFDTQYELLSRRC